MSIFTSFDHAIASGFQTLAHDAELVAGVLLKINGTEPTVEALSTLVPGYGPAIVGIERVSYAALGILASALHLGGEAAKQGLLNAGADQSALQEFEAFIAAFPQVIMQAKQIASSSTTVAQVSAPAAQVKQTVNFAPTPGIVNR
jgi:hypothetical protein